MSLVLPGATSGSVTIDVPAVAGSSSLTLPASTGTVVVADGSGNIASSGTVSATKLIPTSTSVTGNGVYLPATNTVGITTNGAEAVRFDSTGVALFLGTGNAQGGSAAFTIDSNLYNGVCFYNIRAQGATYARFVTGTTRTGSITTTDQTTTLYNTSSDYRLKTNVAPMVDGLSKIMNVKPVTYTWISTGKPSSGFIAHELQEVFPEAVSGVKDAVDENGNIDPQGVDASKLVPTLVLAIQQLKAEIDALKAQLNG